MCTLDYCTVLPSWDFDIDPAAVIEYCVAEEYSTELECGEEFEDLTNITNRLLLHQVSCDESEPCTVSVTCKPQYLLGVNGTEVISEARTIEVYDNTEGYLQTVKGTKLKTFLNEDLNIYKCRIKMPESVLGFSLKFLSLGSNTSFSIIKIRFFLTYEVNESFSKVQSMPMLDMSKVKGYLQGMGDSFPQSATTLMDAIEARQNSQMLIQSSLQNIMGKNFKSDLNIMAVLSALSPKPPDSTQDSGQQINCSDGPGTEKHFVDNAHIPQNCSEKGDIGEDQEHIQTLEMYKQLQDVCQKVTSFRAEEMKLTSQDLKKNDSIEEEIRYDECGQPITEPLQISTSVSPQLAALNLKDVEQLIVKQCKETEERLIDKFNCKLSQMEERIGHKLDSILSLLQTSSPVIKQNMKETES